MAVKAIGSATITDETDIDSLVTWYRLSDSDTSTVRTNYKTALDAITSSSTTPSGWSTAEPAFQEGSTKYLHTVIQTRWKDGTCTWGDVQLSSAYEASKQAYNRALATQTSLDNMEVGGRNLLRKTGTVAASDLVLTRATVPSEGIIRLTPTTSAAYAKFKVDYLDYAEYGDGEYTVSFDVRLADVESSYTSNNVLVYGGYNLSSRVTSVFSSSYDRYGGWTLSSSLTSSWQRVSKTFVVPTDIPTGKAAALAAGNYLTVELAASGSKKPIEVRKVKLERGNVATDWTPAPEDMDSAIETVQSNLDASRSWYATSTTAEDVAAKEATITPATTAFALTVGTIVNVEFSVTNSAAVADLTLSVNGTAAKSIKYMYCDKRNNIPGVGYLVAGFVYQFMYDGDYWTIQNLHYNTNTTYNLGNNLYYNTILAKSAIVAESIIVGDSSGYAQAASGVTFDLSYPILWTKVAFAANGTGYSDLYTSIYDRNLKTNYSSFQGTAKAIVYLVGTVSGNTFTIDSSVLTSDVPDNEDGKVYIPIGRHGNQYIYASKPAYFFFECPTAPSLYAFLDGEFRQVTPTDVVKSQTVYYRSASNTAPSAPKTTLVTTSTLAGTSADYNTWLLSSPPLAVGTTAGLDKYPYLFSCTQYKRLDGTIECSAVARENSAQVVNGDMVINGSLAAEKIVSHSITANQIDSKSITADEIAGNTLTLSQFNTELGALIETTGDKVADLSAAIKLGFVNNVPTITLDAWEITDANGNHVGLQKFTTSITNTSMQFQEDGQMVTEISNKRLYVTDAEVTGNLMFGGYAFIPRSNGNLSLKWIGGNS